jgi:phosphatidate cytidylyltransferase
VFGGTFLLLPPVYFSALLTLILLFILTKEWPQFPNKIKALTPVYPVLPFFLLAYLNQNPEYHNLLHYLFAMVFANDGGAYLAGSLLGKTKVVPSISPNKSWEGIAGGFGLSTAALTAMLLIDQKALSLKLLPFSLLVTAVSTSGDLFESWLKRKADIKDTGTLLPGHGGLLDRFDSIMAVSFLFFALKNQLTPLLLAEG